MTKVRMFALCLLIVILSMGALAQAQDVPFPCGGLSAEDCAVLETASNNMSALNSGSLTANLTFSGIMDGADASFGFDLAATWTGAGVGMEAGAGLALNPTDTTAILNQVTENIAGFNGALSLTITPPPGDTTLPAPLTLDLRLVDSIGYINFDSLGMLTMMLGPDAPTGWGGTNLTDLLTQFGPMLGGMTGSMGTTPEATPQGLDPATLMLAGERHITIVRDGNTFNYTIDLSGLLADPEIQALVQAQGGEALTQDDMAIAENTTASASVALTADGQYIETINLTIDTSDPDTNEPLAIAGTFTFADHDTAALVTAPEGATVVTTEELMNGVSGAMGAMGGS